MSSLVNITLETALENYANAEMGVVGRRGINPLVREVAAIMRAFGVPYNVAETQAFPVADRINTAQEAVTARILEKPIR